MLIGCSSYIVVVVIVTSFLYGFMSLFNIGVDCLNFTAGCLLIVGAISYTIYKRQ